MTSGRRQAESAKSKVKSSKSKGPNSSIGVESQKSKVERAVIRALIVEDRPVFALLTFDFELSTFDYSDFEPSTFDYSDGEGRELSTGPSSSSRIFPSATCSNSTREIFCTVIAE